MWIYVRSKDAQKQLARTSLNSSGVAIIKVMEFYIESGKITNTLIRTPCSRGSLFWSLAYTVQQGTPYIALAATQLCSLEIHESDWFSQRFLVADRRAAHKTENYSYF